MEITDPPLELHFYFTHGRMTRFIQDDPKEAGALLSSLPPPDRLFSQPYLMVGGDQSYSVLRSASVTRLDIIADSVPTWPFLQQALSVRDIGEEAFERSFDPEEYAEERRKAWDKPGQRQLGFTQLELNDGQNLFWEVEMESKPMLTQDIAQVGKSLLASDGLHARRQDRGVMIINPANIVRLTFAPGPPTLPPRIWKARLG